jgi:hypothetical protein
MKELKSNKYKEREHLIDAESSKYWNEHDSSEILETGEQVAFEIRKPDFQCTNCSSPRIRKRMIDLPILDDMIVLKKMKVLFCPDCETSFIEDEGLEELQDRLHRLDLKFNIDALHKLLDEGLVTYEKKWAEKVKERKNVTIYFPSKEEVPKKAQISLQITDPLYPKIHSLTSEDVRKILGLRYFEDLEAKAKEGKRSISQYLKVELAKRILDNTPNVDHKEKDIDKNTKGEINTITINLLKIDPAKLKENQSEFLRLAAKSYEEDQIVYLESAKQEFTGTLHYDYSRASVYIEVIKNDTGHNVFDVELYKDDKNILSEKDLAIENNQILFRNKTEDISEDISKITLKLK